MLKLDIGCGALKRPGFIGIDRIPGSEVHCDLVRDRLPFDDDSADHIYSSHFLEHIEGDNIPPVFKEMIRVAANGALLELWHPHAFHHDAFILGHKSYLTEEQYRHFCADSWPAYFGASLSIEEIRYHVEAKTLAALKRQSIAVDFAIHHLQNIVKEIGIYLRVGKPLTAPPSYSAVRAVCSEKPGMSYIQARDNCITRL